MAFQLRSFCRTTHGLAIGERTGVWWTSDNNQERDDRVLTLDARYANELVDAVDKVLFFGVADTAFRLDRVRFWPNRYAGQVHGKMRNRNVSQGVCLSRCLIYKGGNS